MLIFPQAQQPGLSPQCRMSSKAGQGAQSSFSSGTRGEAAKDSNLEKKSLRGDYDRVQENQEWLELGEEVHCLF